MATASSFMGSISGRPTSTSSAIPRWGRGQETYGEDPFLTARMGVAFVTGMQGDDPHYYRVISTPKHYAVHSGPESTRHSDEVLVSKHDELDTYLPAFRATVTEAKAGSVMCAYNALTGSRTAPMNSCLKTNCAANGDSKAMWSRIAARCAIFRRPPLQPSGSRLSDQPHARHGQRVHRFPRQGHRRSRLQAVSRRREGRLSEGERDRHRAGAAVYRAHQAGAFRSAADGALHEDRCRRAGQRRASRAGAQAGQ